MTQPEPRCGVSTPPERRRATLFCERPLDHPLPHEVYGANGVVIREWSHDPTKDQYDSSAGVVFHDDGSATVLGEDELL